MRPHEAVFPADRHALYDAHGYSAAIRSGDLLFVSGQVGSRPDGTPEPDFERQVQRAFEYLNATIQATGCGFQDIVDVAPSHTDPARPFGTILTVTNPYFTTTHPPTWHSICSNCPAAFPFYLQAHSTTA